MRVFFSLAVATFCVGCSSYSDYRSVERESADAEITAMESSSVVNTEINEAVESQASIIQVDYPRINGRLIDRCAVYNGKASCSKQATSDVTHATCRRLGMHSGAAYTWKLEPAQQVNWWNFAIGQNPRLVPHPDSATPKGVLIVLKCYE